MDNASFVYVCVFFFASMSNIQRHRSEMIMMTVKAMINFLFYQIWHFAASGSFYYQFHSQMSRDLFCFDFPNTILHFSLMFFNIKYTLLISILSVFIENLYYLPCEFALICYCYFYLFTWSIHLYTWSCSSYLIQV